MLGNFSCYCCRLLTYFKTKFFVKFFQEYYQGVGSLDPDCLQRLSADDKIKSDFILNPLYLGNP